MNLKGGSPKLRRWWQGLPNTQPAFQKTPLTPPSRWTRPMTPETFSAIMPASGNASKGFASRSLKYDWKRVAGSTEPRSVGLCCWRARDALPDLADRTSPQPNGSFAGSELLPDQPDYLQRRVTRAIHTATYLGRALS